MKNLLLLVALFCFNSMNAQENEILKIIVVRHAEKGNDEIKNPSLSEQGKLRAQKLSDLMYNVQIDAAYSTSYKRTTQTLTPLCDSKGLKMNFYDARETDSFLKVLKNGYDKTIIVAGHSNTVPNLVNQLIGQDKYSEIHEDDYSNIWILVFKANELIDVSLLNY